MTVPLNGRVYGTTAGPFLFLLYSDYELSSLLLSYGDN
jgi:hypothetical protein